MQGKENHLEGSKTKYDNNNNFLQAILVLHLRRFITWHCQ